MITYRFSPAHIGIIVDHAANLNVGVQSVARVGKVYEMTLETENDARQFAHLQSCTDIERLA